MKKNYKKMVEFEGNKYILFVSPGVSYSIKVYYPVFSIFNLVFYRKKRGKRLYIFVPGKGTHETEEQINKFFGVVLQESLEKFNKLRRELAKMLSLEEYKEYYIATSIPLNQEPLIVIKDNWFELWGTPHRWVYKSCLEIVKKFPDKTLYKCGNNYYITTTDTNFPLKELSKEELVNLLL